MLHTYGLPLFLSGEVFSGRVLGMPRKTAVEQGTTVGGVGGRNLPSALLRRFAAEIKSLLLRKF